MHCVNEQTGGQRAHKGEWKSGVIYDILFQIKYPQRRKRVSQLTLS